MTLRKTNNILDKSLKELSIQVSLSGLSFCIHDTGREEVQFLENRPFKQAANAESLVDEVEQLLQHDEIADREFGDVRVIHDNELCSLVPKALFNESNLSDYLKYNVKILETDYITFDELKSHDIFNVYVPFTNVNNYIFDRFGSFEYKHASTILIETLLHQYRGGDSKRVYVHVGNGHFEIVVLANNKLLLYNSFPFQTGEDFIYYLLFVFEQLDLNREEDELYLLGNITEEDHTYTLAFKYIRNVFIGHNFNTLKVSDTIGELNTQENLVLLNSF